MKKFEDFSKKLHEARGGKKINQFGQFVNEAMSYEDIPVISYERASRSHTLDFVNIGATPHDEDCSQANPDNSNLEQMNKECATYIKQLMRVHGNPPGNAYFFICTNQHDFGEYREACLMFNPDVEEEADYAYKVENGLDTWDEESAKFFTTNEAKDDYIEIRNLNHPIIPDAVKLLKHAHAKMVHTHAEFESVVDQQKFFSLAHSHCFYTEEEYKEWSKNGCKYTDKDSEKSTIIKNTGDLVGVWDNKNGVGYVLVKNKVNEMATIKGTDGMSINDQHDYMTLKTPWGNFTASHSGEKVTGRLVNIPGIMGRLRKFLEDNGNGKTIGERFKKLMNEFTKVVPEVLEFSDVEKFTVGDIVTVEDPTLKKKYPGEYTVTKVSPKYIYIKLENGNMGLPNHTLKNTGKKDEDQAAKVAQQKSFAVGDIVKISSNQAASKQFPGDYEIVKKSAQKVTIKTEKGLVNAPVSMLELVKSKK